MNEHVKVSVVIPVYNVEKYLPACLDSVLAQTLSEIEIICVDDCSPDRCPQILDEYAEREERVKVIHLQKNSQQAFARNRGMEIARGEYLYLLDSDDMIKPETLAELYETARKDDLDGIFFDSEVIFDSPELKENYENTYQPRRHGKYEDKVCDGEELLQAFMTNDEWTCYIQRQFWNMAYLRKENICFPEGHEHEDETFAFEALIAAKRVRYIPGTYFIRRYRENSVMTSPVKPKNFYGYFKCYGEMIRFVRDRGISSPAAKFNIARMYERMTKFYPILSETYDLESMFTGKDLDLYLFFKYAMETRGYYDVISPRLARELKTKKHVYLYGAGAIARQVLGRLRDYGIVPERILVSSHEKNPAELQGIPVITIDEIDQEDIYVVVSVTRKFADEIFAVLEENHIPYAYRRKYQFVE